MLLLRISTWRYVYDNAGNLAILQDSRSGITNKYTYDLADRLVKTEDSNGNWFKYDYDKTDKTSKKENYIPQALNLIKMEKLLK